MMKALMAGVMAGIIVGIVAGILLFVINAIGFLSGLPGLICPLMGCLTCVIGWPMTVIAFAAAAIFSLLGGLFAAKRISAFAAPGDMFVGGAIGGVVAGVIVAIVETIVQAVNPAASLAISFVLALLGLTGKNPNFGALITDAIKNIVMNLGWVAVSAGIFFLFGIILGLLGGIGGSLVFKASGKSKD